MSISFPFGHILTIEQKTAQESYCQSKINRSGIQFVEERKTKETAPA
jgi:hypothetical protein